VRTIKARYSWNPDRTERGIIKVRRADTQISYATPSHKRPDIGQAYIARIKADGSEGQIDRTLYANIRSEEDFARVMSNTYVKAWKLEPVE
jgi:hypothetical protein